jgi:hypothetical protein
MFLLDHFHIYRHLSKISIPTHGQRHIFSFSLTGLKIG